MKFRYLSSDFLASYDEVIEELETKQAEIDSVYEEKIASLIEREKTRLNVLVPQKYNVDDVVNISGSSKTGRIVSTHIEFTTTIEELDDFGRPHYGPGRYYTIRNEREENSVTLGGCFRVYTVKSKPSTIESDWGIESVIENYYEDEIFNK